MNRLLCVAMGFVLAGCAGYQLGPNTTAGYRSVAVPMFRNATYRPQLEAQITNGIIKRFQTDGTLRVEPVAKADVILTGEIVRYERRELRSLRNDTGTPREYRLTIEAKIEARDRVTGQPVLPPTPVSGTADVFIGSDLQSSEAQVLPLIADDLAEQVVTLLAEKW